MSDAGNIWWLSYANEKGPRGVCIVRATSFLLACRRARQLGISPGGQVRGSAAPSEFEAELAPFVGKHLSPAEAEALGGRPHESTAP